MKDIDLIISHPLLCNDNLFTAVDDELLCVSQRLSEPRSGDVQASLGQA